MRLFLAMVTVLAVAGASSASSDLSSEDRTAIFKAAGFKAKGGNYVRCEDDVTQSYMPGRIESEDLNGDGVAEAWVKESSTFCYGNTAEYFVLVAKGAKGAWTQLLESEGIPTALKSKTKGWSDIEVGGPGFGPFPVYRYDGKVYAAKKK